MDKYKAFIYAVGRNFARYIGGYLGGHFYRFSIKKQLFLNKCFSQQYSQRKGK